MTSDLTFAELKEQIRKYELQLEQEKLKNAKQREKITTMSAEVVDSNPYRWLEHIFNQYLLPINLYKLI